MSSSLFLSFLVKIAVDFEKRLLMNQIRNTSFLILDILIVCLLVHIITTCRYFCKRCHSAFRSFLKQIYMYSHVADCFSNSCRKKGFARLAAALQSFFMFAVKFVSQWALGSMQAFPCFVVRITALRQGGLAGCSWYVSPITSALMLIAETLVQHGGGGKFLPVKRKLPLACRAHRQAAGRRRRRTVKSRGDIFI